jgi:glycosyltransferase involved in cell wall biosynthesis
VSKPADVKVAVVMPALNAAVTLRTIAEEIPRDWVDDIILVDDRSTDGTVELARSLGLTVIRHPHNVGYGGNQKTCYLTALQRGADIVIMLHPDGQYEPALIPKLVQPIIDGKADFVLGSRFLEPGAPRRSGMPLYKIVANHALTAIENRILRTRLSEMHTGYRAYSRRLLMTVPFLRNALDFSFDSEMLMQAVHFGFPPAEVPARTRYFEDASSVGLKAASVYGLKTLFVGLRLILHRSGILPCRRFQA